ncbi:hypothetical protein LTR08_003739 [Meristemomyces frigidus]|nr:hypothetical protein LTR08_003739 [Meristemomyces frigidus]
MRSFLAGALCLSVLASAAPTLSVRDVPQTEFLNVTYSSSSGSLHNSSLPNVLILATGGTIAGSSTSSEDDTHYQAGVIGVAALVAAVPDLLNISNIDGVQFANKNSGDITSADVLQLSKLINYALCRSHSNYTGAVVTHGTDTLEETAFTLDITLSCSKPIVIVGAMRPATATSADGPGNLLEAVTVAVDPRAKGRGALIVLNDRIGQAWYTIKRNANTLETFGAPEQGFVGGLLSYTPFWYYPATRPTFKQTFKIAAINTLPAVEIIYAHESYNPKLIKDAISDGAQGIVIAGTGAGDESLAAEPYIAAAVAQGVPVVISTKINVGCVVPSAGSDTIAAGFLNPVKSRIQLQYALANNYSMNATRASFEQVLGSMIGYGASG